MVTAPAKRKGRPKKSELVQDEMSGSDKATYFAKANLISLLKDKCDQINQAIEVIEAL